MTKTIAAAALIGVTALASTTPASAQRWRYGHHGGWGWGGAAAGLAAGAIIGGALAARPYYGPYGPYYGPAPAYVEPDDDAVAYCMQRFKSYDPGSGTYLGYDGMRHPCP